jgi:2-polyprenyl-3-methyl-5-hydroxy-6-metoxy-1,4-benzoquinol methylase
VSQPERAEAEVDLEVVPLCDLCGSSSAAVLFPTRDRLHGLPGTFRLVRCEGCGLVRLSPRPTPDQLGLYYPDEGYLPHKPGAFTQGSDDRAMGGVRDAVRDEVLRGLGYPKPRHPWIRPLTTVARRPLLRRISFDWAGFPPYVEGGRVLDVGSGNGFFLAMLRHHGWKVQGLDLSASAAEMTRRESGIDVHVGEVTDDVFEPEQFDFIHMSHVIEHVPSPTIALARVRELLRPGGLLYIETPNIASLGARLWGRYWFALDSPRHLWLFTPETMSRALRESGLAVDRLTTIPWTQVAWEATYQWEERQQEMREPRPSVGLSERPKLVASQVVTRLGRLVRPHSGDILSCWASRPD